MKSRGFTLIETLLYMVIFALISSIAIASLGGMSKALNSLRSTRGSTDAILVSFERMVREIRSAESVDTAGSTLGSNPGTLTLNTGIKFFLSSGRLMVQEGVAGASALTPSSVSFSSLVFRKIKTRSSEGVKIEAVANGKTMNTTAVLRRSY